MSEIRVTAYWYASQHGLPCDLDSLAVLGLAAAREARWRGVPEFRIPEGPFPAVHTWPEEIWDYAVRAVRAEQGVMEIYRRLSAEEA